MIENGIDSVIFYLYVGISDAGIQFSRTFLLAKDYNLPKARRVKDGNMNYFEDIIKFIELSMLC